MGNAVAGSHENPPGILTSGSSPAEAPVVDGGFSVELYDYENLYGIDKDPHRLSLPPKAVRRWSGESIETPLDARGLIRIPELIAVVKDTLSPDYIWPRGKKNESTHHIYYDEADYPYYPDDQFSPGVFRELPIHKLELPRAMHNWLHIVMDRPKAPSQEVMQYQVRSYRLTKNLFSSAREAIQWERRGARRADYIDRNPDVRSRCKNGDADTVTFIAEILEKNGEGIELHLAALDKVPPEFRFIEPASNPHQLAKQLYSIGQLFVPKSLKVGRLVNSGYFEAEAA
jgi:hypothetical protein